MQIYTCCLFVCPLLILYQVFDSEGLITSDSARMKSREGDGR